MFMKRLARGLAVATILSGSACAESGITPTRTPETYCYGSQDLIVLENTGASELFSSGQIEDNTLSLDLAEYTLDTLTARVYGGTILELSADGSTSLRLPIGCAFGDGDRFVQWEQQD